MKYFLIILFYLLLANCSINKAIKHHGVHKLNEKQEKLIVNKTNINDIKKILGPPSTVGDFDNTLLIYIERKNEVSSIIKLGKEKILINNVLILEIDEYGILKNKKVKNVKDMNKIKFSSNKTDNTYQKQSFVYDFLSSMRQKINKPKPKQ
jgi:outer membrane protein assembly factor BamE (lipoprotein component of BamABCDE complex)